MGCPYRELVGLSCEHLLDGLALKSGGLSLSGSKGTLHVFGVSHGVTVAASLGESEYQCDLKSPRSTDMLRDP